MTGPAANVLALIAQSEQPREHVNPYLVGVGTFVFLVICLAVTLAFNRDR